MSSRTRGRDSKHSHNAKSQLYKTELCRGFSASGSCRYGDKCQFAHGRAELRPAPRHPKYKTEKCKTFWTVGTCPYGSRCRFLHGELMDGGYQTSPEPVVPHPMAQPMGHSPHHMVQRGPQEPLRLHPAYGSHPQHVPMHNPMMGGVALHRRPVGLPQHSMGHHPSQAYAPYMDPGACGRPPLPVGARSASGFPTRAPPQHITMLSHLIPPSPSTSTGSLSPHMSPSSVSGRSTGSAAAAMSPMSFHSGLASPANSVGGYSVGGNSVPSPQHMVGALRAPSATGHNLPTPPPGFSSAGTPVGKGRVFLFPPVRDNFGPDQPAATSEVLAASGRSRPAPPHRAQHLSATSGLASPGRGIVFTTESEPAVSRAPESRVLNIVPATESRHLHEVSQQMSPGSTKTLSPASTAALDNLDRELLSALIASAPASRAPSPPPQQGANTMFVFGSTLETTARMVMTNHAGAGSGYSSPASSRPRSPASSTSYAKRLSTSSFSDALPRSLLSDVDSGAGSKSPSRRSSASTSGSRRRSGASSPCASPQSSLLAAAGTNTMSHGRTRGTVPEPEALEDRLSIFQTMCSTDA